MAFHRCQHSFSFAKAFCCTGFIWRWQGVDCRFHLVASINQVIPLHGLVFQLSEAAEELQLNGVDFSGQADVWNVKLFRWLDNKEDSASYRKNVEQLVPAIMTVLPIRYRDRVVKIDSFAYRMARLEKEVSEAKQALMLDAPKKEKLKELGEGIFEMFRVDPDLTAPLLAMVTTMLGAM